jgi:hypothetical protein
MKIRGKLARLEIAGQEGPKNVACRSLARCNRESCLTDPASTNSLTNDLFAPHHLRATAFSKRGRSPIFGHAVFHRLNNINAANQPPAHGA